MKKTAALAPRLGARYHPACAMASSHVHWPEPLRVLDRNGALARADREIVAISRSLRILKYINPANAVEERERFFAGGFRFAPRFRYLPLAFDPTEVRRRLKRLRLRKILDRDFVQLYRAKRKELLRTMDLLEAVGTERFMPISLRMFGPRIDALGNPAFLEEAKHFVSLAPEKEDRALTPERAAKILMAGARHYARQGPFTCTIKIRDHLSSNAAAGERSVVLRAHARYSRQEILAMSDHEISIHILTAHNGFLQPLRIFGVGLPGYLQDQEGYAIFSEFMRRFLTPNRLRIIGGRALAVDMMVRGASFPETFASMMEECGFDREEAFSICERAYRGGGYTKDVIYFQGFVDVFKAWIGGMDLGVFSIGKMAIDHMPLVEGWLKKGYLRPARFLPRFLAAEPLESRRALFQLFSRPEVREYYAARLAAAQGDL